jgi:hypothetical protein
MLPNSESEYDSEDYNSSKLSHKRMSNTESDANNSRRKKAKKTEPVVQSDDSDLSTNSTKSSDSNNNKKSEFQDLLNRKTDLLICSKEKVKELNRKYSANKDQKFISELCVEVFGEDTLRTHSLTGKRGIKCNEPRNILNPRYIAYILKQYKIRLEKFEYTPEQIKEYACDSIFKQKIIKVTKSFSTLKRYKKKIKKTIEELANDTSE